MSISNLFTRVALCGALAGFGLSATALPLTLNTTGLDANSKLSLSTEAIELLILTGIEVSPGGKATSLGSDAFNIPISSLTVDVKLLPPNLAPVKAVAGGSSLTLTNTLSGGSVSFGNLALDFNALSIAGDISTPAGSQTQVPLFTFKVTQPLTFSTKGGISLTESLGSLYLTDSAAQTFAQGLKVPNALASLFTQVDFGTIDARIVPWFRPKTTEVATRMASTMLSSAALAVSPVPEASVGSLWCLGLLALGAARWRRAAS
jgi:hypothetical protein